MTLQEQHCGFIAILGAPNAGKSTLLNRIIGAKVSIVSPKPQTTRNRVLGILVEENMQYVFIDTPGIFAPRRRLDKAMVQAAWSGAQDADALILMIDASYGKIDGKTQNIIDQLQGWAQKVFVVLNKVDVAEKENLLKLADAIAKSGVASQIFMVSALTGDGISDLMAALKPLVPKGAFHFPEDQLTDMPQRLLASEIIREHLFRQLRQELPYELAVEPEVWETFKNGSVKISAKIVLSREHLKPIVLGAGGKQIKSIREAAQAELAEMLETQVHLFLHVVVDEKWQEKRSYYSMWNLDFD